MATQSDYRYTLETQGITLFEVVSFVLNEALSSLFYLELDIASFSSNANFSEIIDKSATLTFWKNNTPIRYVNGVVTKLVQGRTGTKRTRYKMVIEPDLSHTNLQSDCRIFQQQDSEKIIRAVLQKNNINSCDFDLTEPYWQREYCVQYRETDLEFIQRIAAEEGSYYFFEHKADAHILHFSNSTALAQEIGHLIYNANPSGDKPDAALWTWEYEEKLESSMHVMRDYTFTNPRYSQEHTNTNQVIPILGDNVSNSYEKYDYPGRYKSDAQGEPFNRYRLEFERREAEVAIANGDDLRVIPGYSFTLSGHVRNDFNTSWLVVSVEHHGYQPGILEEEAGDNANRYENKIKLIPRTTQWRPMPQPRPKVDGPQIAHVVGPKDEEIYCDEWGRVKIQFPWDRVGDNNEQSSCWVRVSQAWAGAQYGNIAIPRIGHEVIVNFLEGDPDQPIITGRTYHSTTEPPYILPKHKTRMTIKSKTHKGNGFNELRFEDEKNREEIFIHAQRDQKNVVKHDEITHVGNDRTENVAHNEEVHIGNNRVETVGIDEHITIGQDQYHLIQRNRITKINKDDVRNIGNHQKVDIVADQSISNGGHYQHSTGKSVSWVSGEKISHKSKTITLTGSDRVEIAGKNGSIVLDSSGITLKGVVTIKGQLAIIGGSAAPVKTVSTVSNDGKPLCDVCDGMKNKG